MKRIFKILCAIYSTTLWTHFALAEEEFKHIEVLHASNTEVVVKVNKISPSVLLEKRKAAAAYLKNHNIEAAKDYRDRMCESEWDTRMFHNPENDEVITQNFELGETTCGFNDVGQFYCETPWSVECVYRKN